jgi:hypothetical protein
MNSIGLTQSVGINKSVHDRKGGRVEKEFRMNLLFI